MDADTIILAVGLVLNLLVSIFTLFESRIKLEQRLTKMETMLQILMNQLHVKQDEKK